MTPTRSARSLTLLGGALLSLVGCATTTTNYQAPELNAPVTWSHISAPIKESEGGSALKQTPWWSAARDSTLAQLQEHAKRNNPTLEQAMARLTQARSSSDQTIASAYPSVTGSAGNNKAKNSTLSNVGISTSWEIDLFGAVRSGLAGANARVDAQAELLAAAQSALSADVTERYLALRAGERSVALLTEDLASRQATEKLTQASVEVGMAAPYLATRTRASVADGEASLIAAKAQVAQLQNALVRLTGLDLPALQELLTKPAPDSLLSANSSQSLVPSLTVEAPAVVLSKRLDLRAAERSLAAAAADIGLAKANQYPRLSLSGNFSWSQSSAGGAQLTQGAWSYGPTLSVPLFDAGLRKAAVVGAQARYEEALASYQGKVRSAVQEVNDALIQFASAQEKLQAAQRSALEYTAYFAAAQARYSVGAASLLELEDARRVFLGANQSLLGARQDQWLAWAAFYRALGQPEPATESTPLPSQAS